MSGRDAVTALKRFGLGPRPGDLARIAADPRGFVTAQLDMPHALAIGEALPSAAEAWRSFIEYRTAKRLAKQTAAIREQAGGDEPGGPAMQMPDPEPPTIYHDEVVARVRHALATEAPFLERLAGFWANHFCVSSAGGGHLRSISGAYEREAIRPHVLGRFRDMLHAVVRHPAMLVYLDNAHSVGPNSPAGRRHGKGLNENLARELLELHTLGVDGGYTQTDVTNFARALTGWSIYGRTSPRAGEFLFRAHAHEPGSFTILGREYEQRGVAQAEAVLDDLAAHPSTARRIARKLALHFVGDRAPASLVERLAAAFRKSDGDLKVVSAALLHSDEAWAAEPVKLLPPYDLLVAACRAVRLVPPRRLVLKTLNSLAQPMWGVPSPDGWPDEDDAWAAPDAVLERIDWASRVAAAAAGTIGADIVELAADLLGGSLSGLTRQAIERAESREQALVLLLLSPEFQRR